jgi:hypothetical protein
MSSWFQQRGLSMVTCPVLSFIADKRTKKLGKAVRMRPVTGLLDLT